MGFHQYDTTFTLDPRIAMSKGQKVSRGIGNQVTVEFNLLYRFHCAISKKDEEYVEDLMRETARKEKSWDPKSMSLPQFLHMMGDAAKYKQASESTKPWEQEFGLKNQPQLNFKRNTITGLFNDEQMVDQLIQAMDDPICESSIRHVPNLHLYSMR